MKTVAGLAIAKREGETYFVSELLGDGVRTISETGYVEGPLSVKIPWYIPFKSKVRALISDAWQRSKLQDKHVP